MLTQPGSRASIIDTVTNAYSNYQPLFTLIFTGVISIVVGFSIPTIVKWLKECITQIGKLDKNAIEEKINAYYVHGKISEEHLQFLRDRISVTGIGLDNRTNGLVKKIGGDNVITVKIAVRFEIN